jgi:hypothetical protein
VDARDLYGLPLERFIPERKGLAKELRSSGKRDQAEAVAALRKPSLAAWAVNQLVRTQRRDVGALFKAGDAARRAQAALLAGSGNGPALRAALDDERAAVDRLTRAARGLLSTEGHELSPAILERVADTLHAAALQEEARGQVKDGCLDRELRHVGLAGAGFGGEPQARSRTRSKASADRTEAGSALRKREGDARRTVERAARDLRAAEDRATAAAAALTAAKETLEQAKQALAEARRRAREAEAAHGRARRELDSR